ncbi:MAG: hypothetical protein IPL43_11740 [Micropruina sp.]|nr:hypothetical protein [Micropruina sp.]
MTDARVAARVAGHPEVDRWFDAWSQRLLAGAVDYLRSVAAEDPWHDRIALSISAAVVRLSRQDSDTRYAAVAKQGDFQSGLAVLEASLRRTCDYLRSRSWKLRAEACVFESDARNLEMLGDDSHDAAIFSPPYPNAYEYWLYHKYRMYWLRQDPIAVRTDELGARPHYSKKNGLHEDDFAVRWARSSQMSRVLRPGSPVAIVVGDSMIGGRVVDNRSLLFDAAAGAGFTPRAATTRTIVRRRSSFNGSHGRGRDFEHMLLLERDQ